MAVDDKPQKIDYSELSKFHLIEKIKEQNKEIKKLNKRKKYGLVWNEERVKEVFEEEVQKKLPVLKDITKNGIEDKSKPNNVLIEGDNYHALSVLNYTHKGRIDVIYIDPPYNTGKEFTYNDKIVDKEDSYKHSKWLSFMNKRLLLAKKILSRKGVIFISVDDHEQAQLKILCNDVFDEENFIASIVWQKKYSPQNDAKYFSDMHDFILVYAKKKNTNGEKKGWVRNLIPRTDEMNARYKNPDNDYRGLWKSADLSVKRVTEKDTYEIETPSGRKVLPPKGRSWVTSKEKVQEWIKDNRIWFGKTGNNVPALKIFLNEVQQGLVPTTWWDRIFAGDNQDAKQELKRFDLEDIFDTPKPVKLIKRILETASTKESIILDFMAGSGTTGQAVLELNREDGGNRKFILCTNNENNICIDVCYPRLKKVIKGYKNSKNETIERLGGNLKYFKTSFVTWESHSDRNKKIMVEQSTEMLCLKEDCFDLIREGIQFKIFKNHDDRYLGIIYYYDGVEPFKKEIKKLNKKINTYVFSLIDEIDQEEFEDVRSMVTLKPIPSAILNVYRKIFAYVQTEKLPRKARK